MVAATRSQADSVANPIQHRQMSWGAGLEAAEEEAVRQLEQVVEKVLMIELKRGMLSALKEHLKMREWWTWIQLAALLLLVWTVWIRAWQQSIWTAKRRSTLFQAQLESLVQEVRRWQSMVLKVLMQTI